MRFLYVTSMNLDKKGADKTHLTEIIASLKKNGHDVMLLYPNYTRRNSLVLPHLCKSMGIKLVGKNYFSFLLYHLCLLFLYLYFLLKFRPEAVYTRGIIGSSFFSLIARCLQIPYIIEINGISKDELEIRRFNPVIKKIFDLFIRIDLKFASLLVCVTQGIIERLNVLYNIKQEKCMVIENGVNLDKFYKKDREECIQLCYNQWKDDFIFGFIGTFAPWQGLIYIVDAVQILKKKDIQKPFKIVLVGDGEENDLIRNKIKEYELEDYFHFTGRIDYEQVVTYLNTFNVGLATFTSKRNSTIGLSPLKLYEYFACEIPIISSDIYNLKKIIDENDCGDTFMADQPADLAEIMLQFLELTSEELHNMGNNGRLLAERNFNWDINAEKLVEGIQFRFPITSGYSAIDPFREIEKR